MRALLWLLLIGIVLGVLAVVGIPVWLVQPFAPQTADGLSWSWTLRQVAPRATAAGLVATLILAAALWRSPRQPAPRSGGRRTWWRRLIPGRLARRRIAIVSLVLTAAGAAWFARQNHFEWLFRPFPDARFVAAATATELKPYEPVIGVALAGDALAFPITRIGYHHLVNTTIGRVPIVATY
jgi:hypothetical protein